MINEKWPHWSQACVEKLAHGWQQRLASSGAGRPRVWLAFSGGVDSTVLLHLAQAAQLPVTALHVNHGWHPDAAAWSRHCQHYTSALGIACLVYDLKKNADFSEKLSKSYKQEIAIYSKTKLEDTGNERNERVERNERNADSVGNEGREKNSPEQAARAGRYRWFQGLVQRGDWLLTAHHADDALTGFLLQLLKNQDPCALLPASRAFAAGRLWRPLLQVSKADLYAFAHAQGFSWLEDPSNQDRRYPRNFLRQQWQAWQDYFPGAPTAVAGFLAKQRRHCQRIRQETQKKWRHLNALTAKAIKKASPHLPAESKTVPWPEQRFLLADFWRLSPWQRWQVLRLACQKLALPPPPERHWQAFQANLDLGKGSLHWDGGSLYLYRQFLYLCHNLPPLPEALWTTTIFQPEPVVLPIILANGQAARLLFQKQRGQGLPLATFAMGLTISFRRPGARIPMPAGRTALKNWLQQQGIPPWQRPYLPLIYQGEMLLAVASVGLAHGVGVAADDAGYWPHWEALPLVKRFY